MTTNNLIKEPDILLERIWQPDQLVLLFSRAINKQSQSLINKQLDWMVVDNNGQLKCTYTISATHIEFFDVKPGDLDEFDLASMSSYFYRAGIGLYGILKCYELNKKLVDKYESLNLYFLNKTNVIGNENVDPITLSEAVHTSQELIKTYAAQVY